MSDNLTLMALMNLMPEGGFVITDDNYDTLIIDEGLTKPTKKQIDEEIEKLRNT